MEPCDFGVGESAYGDEGEIAFGLQFHSFSYPSENGSDRLLARFWYPKMQAGRIRFCPPEECPVTRDVRKMGIKPFRPGENFSFADEEAVL